eukprot:2826474-Rhodomonas_salina.1
MRSSTQCEMFLTSCLQSSSKSQTSPTTAAQKSAASATQAATNRGGKTAGKGKAKIIDGFDEDGEVCVKLSPPLPPTCLGRFLYCSLLHCFALPPFPPLLFVLGLHPACSASPSTVRDF